MMKFIRNSEIIKNIIIDTAIGLMAFAVSLFAVGINAGIIVVILWSALITVNFLFTYNRYKKIDEMSCEIDKILHDCSRFNLKRFDEGELAVLESEIYKMTTRLREQADALKNDKKYLSDSIADISHQIRTPLTSINIITNLLEEPNLDDDRRYELLRELNSLLTRIEWLINALLTISKLDAGTLHFENKKVNVHKLIMNAYRPVSIAMDLRNQSFLIDCAENISINGDFSITSEALENILKNCMEHMSDGGKIDVKVTDSPIFTQIIISDNGSGIDKEDLPHIFERFYKGKNSSSQSVGIGLALARMIIVSQNGTISAENNYDGGASFIIKFYKSII